MKKYWDVVSLQAVRTTMSKTLLSFTGSIPYMKERNSLSHTHTWKQVTTNSIRCIKCLRMRGKHYLVDLVHHSEGAAVELLQGHEVEHCGDAALSSTLMVGRQLVELSAAVKLHPNSNPILVILLLQ